MRAKVVVGEVVAALILLGCADTDPSRDDPQAASTDVPSISNVAEPTASEASRESGDNPPGGVTGTTIQSAPSLSPEVWRLSAQPVVTVGVGSPEQELYRVRQVRRLSDGRIVVANDGTLELRFFDGNGQHLASVGGEGDGPGEFRSLSWMGVTPRDTIITFDLGTGRVSVFDSSGRFVRSVRMPGHMQVVGVDLTVRTPQGVFGDGSLLVEERIASGGGAPSEVTGVTIDSLRFVRFDPRRESINELGRFPEAPSFSLRGGASMGVPMAARPVLLADGSGLYFGSGENPEIKVYAMTGELDRTIRWSQARHEISRADIDAELERLQDPELVTEGRRAFTAPLLEAMHWPPYHPAYTDILLSSRPTLTIALERTCHARRLGGSALQPPPASAVG